MKKLWVIALSLVSTIALAQHDQQETSATSGSRPSQDSKSKTSQSSSYSKGEGTIEGTYQITFTAKAARTEDKGQDGMNASDRINNTGQNTGINSQPGTGIQQNTGGPPSQNQSYSTTPATGNTGTSTSSSSQYGTTTTPANTGISTSSSGNMGTSSSQTQNQPDKNDGFGVTGQERTGNQNMGSTPGTPNQSVQSGNYTHSIPETGMQNNTAGINYSSLSGKKMILTLKNGKMEFSDKSTTESSRESKSKNSTEANASDNSAAVPNVATTMQPEECAYTKTSGSGAHCTITASCKDDGNTKSYWSAYITDGSKINGSVSFVTSGSGSTDYSFTGTRISSSSKKNSSKDTSQR